MWRDIKPTLALAGPIVVVQVGLMLMGVVDTMMVGRMSEADLAAVALGNLLVFGAGTFGMGVLMALDPIVAQAVGANDEPAVARAVQRGMVLALFLTLPASLALLPAELALRLLGQPSDVIPIAAEYALVSIPGMFPFFAFVVMRQSLQAVGRLAPIVATILLSNLANVGLNWAFIFGHLGFPEMGAVGSGWASTISRWLMAVLLPILAWGPLRRSALPLRRESLHPESLMRMFNLGAPVGVQVFLEFGAFAAIALLMGFLGTREVAGHQVALNLAALTFMVPLGISGAAAIRVGHAIGRGDMSGARNGAAASLVCGTAFMCCTALAFLALPGVLARAYTDKVEVLAIAAALIPIAGVFQVFDGLQVVASGILRGAGDTRAPMIVNGLGFWFVGIPTSLALAFVLEAGPRGLWWGLVAGLAAVAMLLLLRCRSKLRNGIARVQMDAASKTPSRIEGGREIANVDP